MKTTNIRVRAPGGFKKIITTDDHEGYRVHRYRRRKVWARYYDRHKNDPEFKKRRLASQRKYMEKLKKQVPVESVA